jgi:predicted alpha/beta-hydrolase family hydrolase
VRIRTVLRWIRRACIAVLLLLFAVGAAYVRFAFRPVGFGPAVLRSDARIRVQIRDDAIWFEPVDAPRAAGFIFYPGCPVPAESYAPFGRAIAEHGHPAVLMRIPYRCATAEEHQQRLFAATAALIASGREWVIGGHSRGGGLASRFVAEHPRGVAGLVLIGTSHPRDVNLASIAIPVTKIYGTLDGISTVARARASASLLPPHTRWVQIEGGNHVQFGWYSFQLWDRPAAISREAQQTQTVDAVLHLFNHLPPEY